TRGTPDSLSRPDRVTQYASVSCPRTNRASCCHAAPTSPGVDPWAQRGLDVYRSCDAPDEGTRKRVLVDGTRSHYAHTLQRPSWAPITLVSDESSIRSQQEVRFEHADQGTIHVSPSQRQTKT